MPSSGHRWASLRSLDSRGPLSPDCTRADCRTPWARPSARPRHVAPESLKTDAPRRENPLPRPRWLPPSLRSVGKTRVGEGLKTEAPRHRSSLPLADQDRRLARTVIAADETEP